MVWRQEALGMEITLTRQSGTQVQVTCDGQSSHSFDLQSLAPAEEGQPGLSQPLDDPVAYGKAAYQALFPAGTLAGRTLESTPERILLVTTDETIDAVPWEYAYSPDGFLVAEYPFVRGLPSEKRIAPPTLESGLHIVAIPSDPLDKRLNPLNIDGEWTRLQEIIRKVSHAVTLERAYPPTIEQVRSLVANQRHRVVHFMGHGGQDEQVGAFLCLEKEHGTLDPVTARQFVQRVRGSVFLVTLNACVSATPGPTPFSNLAAALARQKVPYALGMRVSIHDEDARNFSRQFYSELASGVPVEEALFQARLTLASSSRIWAIGVPVLYTALSAPAGGYGAIAGTPIVEEHKPPIEAIALPRAEGGFQGRIDELAQLGSALSGDERPPVITIHGSGGQGKTALAREAVERFAFAWPGGVWATSFVNLPPREVLVTNLARFLGIAVQEVTAQDELERQVLLRLSQGQPRTLIVLDNVETLIEAVKTNDIAATNLAQFIREYLTRPPVSLLVTSRDLLGWQGEHYFDLGGLIPDEGAKLFQQSAPQRSNEIEPARAEELSRKVRGHPLSLRLSEGLSIRLRSPYQILYAIATHTCWQPKINTLAYRIASVRSTPASRPVCATSMLPSRNSSADYGCSTRLFCPMSLSQSLIQISMRRKMNVLRSMINCMRSGCAACSRLSVKHCARAHWGATACCRRCVPTLRNTWREQKSAKSCWRGLARHMPDWRVSFAMSWAMEA